MHAQQYYQPDNCHRSEEPRYVQPYFGVGIVLRLRRAAFRLRTGQRTVS